MKELLSGMKNRRVDILCGGTARLRGEVVKVENDVLHLKDEDGQPCYVAVDKIAVVWQAREEEHRAGFIPPANNR